MDRLSQLRGEAGGSGDSTLDTTSPPSEAFMSANENSSKYFSLSDSTFDITPMKDVSLASTSADADRSITDNDELISNLSPIGKKELIDSYKIGKQIEAANILSGGVDIFDDNENSFDGDELVIDDNVEEDDHLDDRLEVEPAGNLAEPEPPLVEPLVEPMVEPLVEPLIGPLVEPLVGPLLEPEANEAREMEVVLQIDGNNVDAIDIGNGLYLYRKDGRDELAAIQIIDNNPQHSFKFLKVRDNAEGNLEVYEEIEIEVPKEVPTTEGRPVDKNTSQQPAVDVNNGASCSSNNKEEGRSPQKEPVPSTSKSVDHEEKETSPESKAEVNLNGKMMKFSESRKSPVVGSFTPMTYHSTPNKEGKPLTKTMVDLQLHPNRHSDNVKKTIEVHTDNVKQKSTESLAKEKGSVENDKPVFIEKEVLLEKSNKVANKSENKEQDAKKVSPDKKIQKNKFIDAKHSASTEQIPQSANIDKEKDAIAGKCVNELQNKHTESKESNRELAEAETKVESAISKKGVFINNKESIKILLEPNKSVDLPLSITTNMNETANSTAVNTVVETNKPVSMDINTVPKSSKDSSIEKSEMDKSKKNTCEMVESVIKTDILINVENVEAVTINEIKETGKMKTSKTEDKNTSLITPSNLSNTTHLTNKPVEANVENCTKSEDGVINLPLETFSDVSSTSLNIDTEESKAESITLYAIDTDESVSLITPNSGSETKADEENLGNEISNLTKTSNISNTSNENTAIGEQKPTVNLSVMKDTTLEAKDQLENITKTDAQATEKPKVVEKSRKQIVKHTEDLFIPVRLEKAAPPVSVLKVTAIEKTAKTVPVPAVRPSEKTKSSIPIIKVKPSEKEETSTVAELKPLGKKSSVPEAKSSGKEAHANPIPEIKPLEKALNVIPAPDVNPSIKSGRLITAVDIKTSEKVTQSTPKLEAKPLESVVISTPMQKVKLVEKTTCSVPVKLLGKAAHSTSLPELKPSEITSSTSNKTVKPDGYVPIITISNKPSSKLTSPTVKNEGVKKSHDNVSNPKDISKANAVDTKSTQIKTESLETKESLNIPESQPVNNNHTTAVPFGKWTDVNRQEFLNKFKEVKGPVTANSNSKQIKNSNDLNRRDVLQKIDSQRAQTIINNATAKAQEKVNVKNEAAFSTKVHPAKVETKIPVKSENADKKLKQVSNKVTPKQENSQKASSTSNVNTNVSAVANVATISKTEPAPRDLSTATMASLIDKTIEDMINRVVPCKGVVDEPVQAVKVNANEPELVAQIPIPSQETSKPVIDGKVSLDEIEMKMNELHGIPFVERPPHQLPKIPKVETKTYSKIEKIKLSSNVPLIPNVISTDEPKVKDNVIDIDSEEEVIEHEPVTGDLELNKKTILIKSPAQDRKKTISEKSAGSVVSKGTSDKETIITETDFDKFARRNSVSCENCLTVNFDRKETQDTVQTIKEKDRASKANPKLEPVRIEAKLPHKQTIRLNVQTDKSQGATKFGAVAGDSSNKKYQSKIHTAYQSALTAKHQVAHPITIIEDKPVKVVFVESSTGFVPSQLNVQGQELSPAKNPVAELDTAVISGNDSVDSDMLEVVDENKQQDKSKIKHQRKQVLTPVEAPELELIQPSDIGLEISPKKKRKIEDIKADKQSKNLVHKKSYLLGRNNTAEDKTPNTQVSSKDTLKNIVNRSEDVQEQRNAPSAIDNLVKAAELLENQTETLTKSGTPNPDNQPNTPVKRGRGRPRKYPLPEGATDNKTPSPQKKPRLIDAKPVKQDSLSDERNEDSSEEDMVRENWTMGKINENIVCPICNKLFRSENVVFKHVKHCTGVSPNRSDSDKTSPRRSRLSQESENLDMNYEISISESKKNTPKKRRSKESDKAEPKTLQTKLEVDKDDVIVIEDTPIKEKPEKNDKEKEDEHKKNKAKVPNRANSLVCEFCGKMFRQLSYLVSHKLQHKREQTKKIEKEAQDSNKLQVFSCEVCKKEFRKLHHLVQHRIIHNPDSVPKRTLRKSSSEQNDTKNLKEERIIKVNEDSSAAFRCEPCDKSFRKLHHLVEHRETHDGINRQKPSALAQPTVEKPTPPPQCEICKKSFRKLHHLIEHKEQHADTSSEKSDDKSVKSALSTKDIIHECSLCYMVFPNEHSLNKHFANCSKKKRQSKQPKDITENEPGKDEENLKSEEIKDEGVCGNEPKTVVDEPIDNDEKVVNEQDSKIVSSEVEKVIEVDIPTILEIKETENEEVNHNVVGEKPLEKEIEVKSTEMQSASAKRDLIKSNENKEKEKPVVPEKIKKVYYKEEKTQDTPIKKTPLKDKVVPAATKRQKTIDEPLLVANEAKPVESSDDDEVRYMLNPNFKVDESTEGKVFMKVRASKRNSLQIERPNSNELVKRRTSLQHPPKVPRLKPRAIEPKFKLAEPKPKALEPKAKPVEPKSRVMQTKTSSVPSTTYKHFRKKSETEAVLSTDSDDSDVKYSFPKTTTELLKPVQEQSQKVAKKKVPRKSLGEKRKSLAGIAKRKSLGKATKYTTKLKVNASPVKPIKKRTRDVEHRCDCGQLFSSAALLSRHTSLAHTPPRIRRRRSSPAPPAPPDTAKPLRKSTLADKPTPAVTRKSSVKSDAGNSSTRPSVSTRRSSVKAESATPTDARKSIKPNKSEVKASAPKTRRSATHSGVPVPEKMRKLMQKNIK